MANDFKAFSIIELVITLFILGLLAVIGIKLSTDVMRQTNVVSEMVAIKGSIQKARGEAIMSGVPVLFDYSGDEVLALADFDRDGTFGDRTEELVIGESTTDGLDFDFRGVEMVDSSDSALSQLDHWSGLLNGLSDFPNFEFVITPTGGIRQRDGAPAQGAIFIRNTDGFAAAVYVSALGDIKTAIKEDGGNWVWND